MLSIYLGWLGCLVERGMTLSTKPFICNTFIYIWVVGWLIFIYKFQCFNLNHKSNNTYLYVHREKLIKVIISTGYATSGRFAPLWKKEKTKRKKILLFSL